jgi:excisionase family DNA binding protein
VGTGAEARVAHILVLAILDELRANPAACQELRALLSGRTSDDRLLSPREAAGRLGVHPKTLTRAAAAGRVAGARRVGRHWRFDPSELALEPPRGASQAPAVLARLRSRARGAAADAIRTAGAR